MKKIRTQNMKKIQDSEDYPAVHSWSYIAIEGYCMLNMEYGMCHDRYNYRLNPDRTFTRIKNERYDPKRKPDPYPGDCRRSVRSSCIECRHFGWCDPDDENHDEAVYPPESAIKPAYVKKIKETDKGLKRGKGKTYPSMDAFIRNIKQ